MKNEISNLNASAPLYIGLYLPDEKIATPAALLRIARRGQMESAQLAYGLGYLQKPSAIALNPLYLPLQHEPFEQTAQLIRNGGATPLTLKDALPDAWGRLVLSHELGGRIPSEREMFLLTNEDRVGAMVFSETLTMPEPVALPSHDLLQLADAAKRLQYHMDIPKPMLRLLQRGGSLGGARPKASFTHQNALWLAKFPAAGDPVDVQHLESAILDLAEHCGICVPAHFTLPLAGQETAFLSRRFDRKGINAQYRIHFLSASAVLNIPYESSQGSYIEFARALRRCSAKPSADLAELFRRMIFNLLIDNTDDHLKNHGVLYVGKGQYRLSPAFDLVPQLTNLGYQMLSINGESQISHLALALDNAAHFDLSKDLAADMIKSMSERIHQDWAMVANKAKLPKPLIEQVSACFMRQAKIVGAAEFTQ